MRKINKAGIELIKKYEGLRTEAYLCPAGVWTIGYGHTKGVVKGMKITPYEAEELLREDLEFFERGVFAMLEVAVTDGEFAALVSLAFNIGLTALQKSTLIRLLNEGDYEKAADQFLRWNKAGGKTLLGLTERRKAERELFMAE